MKSSSSWKRGASKPWHVPFLPFKAPLSNTSNVCTSWVKTALSCARQQTLPVPLTAWCCPGGESTVQGKLLEELGMLEGLRARIEDGMPTLATCAGLILLARDLAAHDDRGTPRLGTMKITAERNAYGRQLGSFHAQAECAGMPDVPMTFIRAPYIAKVEPSVEVLARVDGRIVAAREGSQLAVAFHPELDDNLRMHQLFLQM